MLRSLSVMTLSVCTILMSNNLGFTKSPSLKKEATCGDYGTAVHFEDSPQIASKIAKKEGKLVLILHVSGHFEEPQFT
jgi:hypothetical protein